MCEPSDPLAEFDARRSCGCHACLSELGQSAEFYVLCPECGNKRCPKATNHVHACTGSNDSGQVGSVYGVECGEPCCVAFNQAQAEARAQFDAAMAEIGEPDMAAFRRRHNLKERP